MTGFYEVKLVSMTGTVLTTFDADAGDGDVRQKASVDNITWQLNEPGSATITFPLFLPATAQATLYKEVQIYRGGALIFWGVLVQRTLGAQTVTWTCPGLLWYFTQVKIGPVTSQYLANPLFTSDLSSWTAVGATASWSNATRIRGPGTAQLVSASYGDNYLEQTFTVSTAAGGFGIRLYFAAWYFLASITDTAYGERGVYLEAANAADAVDTPSGPGSPQWEPITMNAKTGEPVRATPTSMAMKPGLTNAVVKARLYSPAGTIRWGATGITDDQSVSADQPNGSDHTELVKRIVDYAQTKNNLNMATSTPASGIVRLAAFQHADLAGVFDALKTYPARNICDFSVVTTTTTRTFTTYSPRKGSFKSGSTVTVPGSSVIGLQHRVDGEQVRSRTIMRAPGSGTSREVGVATDTSTTSGLVLEQVGDLPVESTLDDLDAYATAEVARLKAVVGVASVPVPAEGWIGVVDVGDTVPVAIDWGAVQDTATRRVISMTLHPKSDTLDLSFQAP